MEFKRLSGLYAALWIREMMNSWNRFLMSRTAAYNCENVLNDMTVKFKTQSRIRSRIRSRHMSLNEYVISTKSLIYCTITACSL